MVRERDTSRISVARGGWNGGVTPATPNAAFAAGEGEYVGLLDHDDMLTIDSVEVLTKRAVLILSGCPGDAKRYRADHQAEQASMLGMTCDALVVGEIPFGSILERYRCVILHRVAWDASVERLLADAKSAGIPVLFDTDDLVFDPDAIDHVAALEEMDDDEQHLYLSGLHRYRRTLANTDGVIVSTDRLAEEASVVNGVVGLAYNAVSAEMVDLADAARPTASRRSSSVTIAYLSGTPTHNRDFAEAADALLRVLETQPQVRFVAVGHIDLDERFDRFAGQVDRVPLQPWRSLPSILAGVDVSLAPLERDNPFTDSKSCLKYIEAGLVGVPTIASPRRDFVRAIRNGFNGLIADSPDEWHSALERLVANPGERASIGARAAADVREHHTTAARARAFHGTLGRLARAAPGNAPLSVDWVVRAPLPRTGGYRTIFRLASFLAQRGHPTRMYVEQVAHLEGMSQCSIEAFLEEHFEELPFSVVAGHALEPADITFATNWPTAAAVASHPASLFKAYLVQDFEPEFYEQGDPLRNQAHQSYDLPLRHICYGERLATRLEQETKKPADALGFALEPEFRLQRPAAERTGAQRVLFFAKPDQPRRGYAAGVEALRLLHDAERDVEIVLFGSDAEMLGKLPFPYRNLGSITTDELAATLNSAHVLLSLSLTNISHAPYEAMACGCAVVEARTFADPSLRDRENCLLAEPDPAAIASALVELVRDDPLRLRLAASGLETSAGMTWEKTGTALERLLLDWAFLRLEPACVQ